GDLGSTQVSNLEDVSLNTTPHVTRVTATSVGQWNGIDRSSSKVSIEADRSRDRVMIDTFGNLGYEPVSHFFVWGFRSQRSKKQRSPGRENREKNHWSPFPRVGQPPSAVIQPDSRGRLSYLPGNAPAEWIN